jgi:hypothetical protein
VRDLEKLAPINTNSALIANTIEEYNEEHIALFPLKGTSQNFAVMSCSKVGAGRYIDQNNKKIYTVDHFKGEIIAEEDTTVELVESVEELLSHLSKSSLKYA